MSFDLLQTVRSHFTGEYIAKVATQLAEPEAGIEKALAAGIPTILTGLLSKISAPGDATNIFGLVKDAAAHPAGNVTQGVSGNLIHKGEHLLQTFFGNRTEHVCNGLAEYAGIKQTSAHALLQTTAPLSLGEVGKYALDHRMSPLGFLAFLNNHKEEVLKAVPAGLNLPSLMGIGSLDNIGRKLSGIIASIGGGEHHEHPEMPAETSHRNLTWPALILLVLGLMIWWLLRGCGNTTNVQTPPRDTVITSQMETDAVKAVSDAQ